MRLWTMAAMAGLLTAGATAQAAGTVIASDGRWELRQSQDAAAGRPDCTLAPKDDARIAVTRDGFVVSARSKNGIFNYQYRVDDDPPSIPAIPSDAMRERGAIILEGAAFERILSGRRLEIRVLDRLHEAITEEVDLSGLSALHRRMLDACQ